MPGRAPHGWHASGREADISFFTRFLFAAYFLEAGLVLVVAPWSAFWERNFFAAALPVVARVASSPFVRGGISGIGAITAIAGFVELAGMFGARRAAEPETRRNAEA